MASVSAGPSPSCCTPPASPSISPAAPGPRARPLRRRARAFARDRSVPTVVTSHGPATGEWGEYLEPRPVESMYLVADLPGPGRPEPDLPWRACGAQQPGHRGHPVPGGEGRLSGLARPDVPGQGGAPGHRHRTRGRATHSPHRQMQRARRAGVLRRGGPASARPRRRLSRRDGIRRKYEFLGRAAAFVFPLQWEEPFGWSSSRPWRAARRS